MPARAYKLCAIQSHTFFGKHLRVQTLTHVESHDLSLASRVVRAGLSVLAILAATVALGQEPPAPTPNTPPTPPQDDQSVLSRAASASYDRRDALPSINLYLPEGQADIRLRKLIKNVLFESQISYKFVDGDISTFLRYKYYARNFTYKIGVFDSLQFDDITSRADQEFERVRGGLLLMEFPRDYNNRYFWLLQDDRLTFGDITRIDNKKNNIYTKIAYQYGTQFDEHLNQIVGETRGRNLPVLTAFRELGPQRFSFAAALTESARIFTGDYRYTKLEAEALRRWDLTSTSFVVTRAHVGTIPLRARNKGTTKETPDIERYAVPLYEMFKMNGRDALRSMDTSDEATGLHELHVTNEYFVPIFRNRDYRMGPLHWNTLYGIGYMGFGNAGFQPSDIARARDYLVDAGFGAETSIRVRDFDVLLSGVVAQSVRDPKGIGGFDYKFSIRTIR